jgi:dCMP deaminase
LKKKITRNRGDRLDIAVNAIMRNYKASCKNRKLSFELSKEEFKELIYRKCYYCGRPPSNSYKRATGDIIKYNGIDRKDNSLGYFKENSVTCCKVCNQMKTSMDSEVFLEIIYNIQKNQKIKNVVSKKKLDYYYDRAFSVSKMSPDPSTKVGALLIHGQSGAVIAEGYNGFIRGAPDDNIPKTRPEKYDYMVHAEQNLICNAVKHGISTNGCILYCTISPCVKCMRMLYQAGITEIYVKDFYSDFEKCSNMLDLKLTVSKIENHVKIDIEPNK